MANDRAQAQGLKVSSALPTKAIVVPFPRLPKELNDRLSDESRRAYETDCEVFMRSLLVTLRNGA